MASAYHSNSRQAIDDLPGNRCGHALELLRRIRAVSPDAGHVGREAPPWARQAVEDLSDCRAIWVISDPTYSEYYCWPRDTFDRIGGGE